MNKDFYKKIANMPINELVELISETSNMIADESNKLIILLEIQQERISEMQINNVVVECANPNCNNKFVKRKRQKFCSNACKQENYRLGKIHIDGNATSERNIIEPN